MTRPLLALASCLCLAFATACGVPCGGDVAITTVAEWEAFVATGCSEVSGQLSIVAPTLSALTPAAGRLIRVGSLAITGNDAMTLVSLPALHTVDGPLSVTRNSSVIDVSFPSLLSVGGGATILIPGTFTLSENPALGRLSVPQLASVGVDNLGELLLSDDVVLGSVELDALARVPSISVYGLPALPRLELPSLATVGNLSFDGAYGAQRNRALATLDFPVLARAGSVILNRNPVLVTLRFPRLTTVESGLTVTDNPLLKQCAVDALTAQLTPGRNPVIFTTGNTGMRNTCP